MGRYDDIIHMEHPTSQRHPRMSIADRAAQFSPFAALTGHNAAIRETARLTDRRIQLTEDEIARINESLQRVAESVGTGEQFTFTCFVPDGKKSGGSYLTCTGAVRKMDLYRGVLMIQDGPEIRFEDITEIREE